MSNDYRIEVFQMPYVPNYGYIEGVKTPLNQSSKESKMSLEEKIRNAKETDWITDGIPKWQVSLIVFFAKLKVKWRRLLHK